MNHGKYQSLVAVATTDFFLNHVKSINSVEILPITVQSLLKELISKFGFPKLALVMKGTPAAGSPPAVPSTRERVNLRSTRSVDPGSSRGELALILYSN